MGTIARLALRTEVHDGPTSFHSRLFAELVMKYTILGGVEANFDFNEGFEMTFCDGSRLTCRPDINGGQPFVNGLMLVSSREAA